MAPSRGRRKGAGPNHSNHASSSARRPRGGASQQLNGASDIYQDMLAEAVVAEPETSARPLKRRKVASRADGNASLAVKGKAATPDTDVSSTALAQRNRPDEGSSDSDGSDFEFEDVDLEQHEESADDDEIEDVSVSVDPDITSTKRARDKSKGTTTIEKSFRILVHKAHVLCLLGHCFSINNWCNSPAVQRSLRALLSDKTLSLLNPDIDYTQSQRNLSFIDGLTQASFLFRGHFRITASGLRKARWPVEGEGDDRVAKPVAMDRADLINAARDLEGSQDTGNQLFCAFLRSAGVEARLVCSLQPLPFRSPPSKSSTPRTRKHTIYAVAAPPESPSSRSADEDPAVTDSSTIGKVPSARRRLGQPSFRTEAIIHTPQPKKKAPIRRLSYPVFWVEAFNTAQQKWIVVDPLVTQTVNRPTRIEPPSSYEPNHLLYAIAFESTGVARDVTRRYARRFNAKTRRHRVESTEGGAQWFRKAMRLFRRPYALDRDQVEDAELGQREAQEGLPTNVQDFKDHPYYALERHLKRHEVIHPKQKVGRFNAGTAAKPRMEPVYRREDVLVCRSADKWFRLGRIVKEREQPVKHVPSLRRTALSPPGGDVAGRGGDTSEAASNLTALYAPHQTALYTPQPVVQGRVPRNAFGNLDVYVPSMVPAGGTHIRSPFAQQAARLLRVDYVDAVTGFQFKGRRGTTVVEGAVVASECAEAVYSAIEGIQEERAEEASMARSVVALGLWKRFLTGLRIAERVKSYGGEEEEDEGKNLGEIEKDTEDDDVLVTQGVFSATAGNDDASMPTAGKYSLHELALLAKASKKQKRKPAARDTDIESVEAPESEAKGDDDGYDDGDDAGYDDEGRSAPTSRRTRRRVIDLDSDDEYEEEDPPNPFDGERVEGGGFLAEDDVEPSDAVSPDAGLRRPSGVLGGGFLVETEENDDHGGPERNDAGSPSIEQEGGGFLVDEASGDEPMPTQAPTTYEEDDGGGFVVEEGVSQSESGPPHESRGIEHASATPTTTAHADTAGANPMDEDSVEPLPSMVPITAAATLAHEMEEEERSDIGSMLSHDPEDEDAEPDWL